MPTDLNRHLFTNTPYGVRWWDPGPQTDIDRAKHARDQARIEHDAASASYARISAELDPGNHRIRIAQTRLISARTTLYAADAKYAALVQVEEVEEAKKETLVKIEASINVLEEDFPGDEIASGLGWDFLDDQAEKEMDSSVLAALRSYRDRVVNS